MASSAQLGRRNLTPEQKSYLRGKRYNQEKRQDGGHGDQKSGADNRHPKTDEHLAEEYGVAASTIRADGEFADAVDALEAQVRADIRDTILKPHRNGTPKVTKKQVAKAGNLVKTQKVEPLPFMKRAGWKPYQVLQAIYRRGLRAIPGRRSGRWRSSSPSSPSSR